MESKEELYEQLRARKDALDSLQQHPGWLLFRQCVQEQIRARRMAVEQLTVSAMDSLVELLRHQGEAGGLRLALYLPERLSLDTAEDIAALAAEEEEQQDG